MSRRALLLPVLLLLLTVCLGTVFVPGWPARDRQSSIAKHRASTALHASQVVGEGETISEEQWAEVLRLPCPKAQTRTAPLTRRPVPSAAERQALRLPQRSSRERFDEAGDKQGMNLMYGTLFFGQMIALAAVVDWSKF